jgi:hypothetical protein
LPSLFHSQYGIDTSSIPSIDGTCYWLAKILASVLARIYSPLQNRYVQVELRTREGRLRIEESQEES